MTLRPLSVPGRLQCLLFLSPLGCTAPGFTENTCDSLPVMSIDFYVSLSHTTFSSATTFFSLLSFPFLCFQVYVNACICVCVPFCAKIKVASVVLMPCPSDCVVVRSTVTLAWSWRQLHISRSSGVSVLNFKFPPLAC